MWLSKPLYELVPFCYMGIGILVSSASFFVGDGPWPVVCAGAGLASLTGGMVLWLKRRDYRSSRSRTSFQETLRG